MYFPDGETQDLGDGYSMQKVGWLSKDHPFDQGPVSTQWNRTLQQHAQLAWQPSIYAGWHDCELCLSNPAANSFNLFIPSKKIIYYAPCMIDHYVIEHNYRPPQLFVEAVAQCPAQASPEYYDLLHPFAERWTQIRGAGLKRACMRRRFDSYFSSQNP